MLEFFVLFFAVYFWGSPIGLSSFFGHCGAVIISLSSLRNISKNYLFWIIILLTILSAQEIRFSLEYILLATTFFYIGKDKLWDDNEKENKRRKILFWIFLFLVITNKLRYDFSERGSLLLWLPVFLVLYYKPLGIKNFLIYLASGLALFFSNKLTTFASFIISTRSKLIYLFSFFMVGGYFFYKESISNFLIKSFEPRLHIAKSVWEAFLQKPFFGHGFGTFALDFPLYRTHAKVLGGRISEQVVHGHSLFNHFAFELGLFGLFLVFILFYLLYINVPRVVLPLVIICFCDSPLVTFNQYLLFGLLIIPFIKNYGVLKLLFCGISNNLLRKISFFFVIIFSLCIFIPSLLGHYYYDSKDINKAIKWDRYNSLYYFTRGADNLNQNPLQSEKDFTRAIELSPSVSYFYGFLGASQLANNKLFEAKKSLEKAMKLDGRDGYWCLLYSYVNYEDKKIFEKYQKKAFKKNPEIKEYLSASNINTPRFIGYTRRGDVRLAGFYRTGEKIYFPLPVIE